MHVSGLEEFAEIWFVDFEFRPQDGVEGSLPEVVCVVAHELRSGRTVRRFQDELGLAPPYPVDEQSLFVAYFASAEISCHLALGWPVPERILDLYCEFRNSRNGLGGGRSLLNALVAYGIDHIDAVEKTEMRDLVLRGGPWTDEERVDILDYCESDVGALKKLVPSMLQDIDLPRALYRGRYMAAVARMEHNGVAIDGDAVDRFETARDAIVDELIAETDDAYGIYEGRTFKLERFVAYLQREGIPWPHNAHGRPILDKDTFHRMEREYPQIRELAQLRAFLGENRAKKLPVGRDGRNRTLLSPFASSTGRNQPSTTNAIFGRSAWYRSFIKPAAGHGVAYVDWGQQEVGIAAALSGDPALMAAYESGDPYLAFGKQAGKIPEDGSKRTHKAERDRFKACVLAVQYGMGEKSLSEGAGITTFEARDLLRMHRETYPRFWEWSQAAVDDAFLLGHIQTVFGWRIRVSPGHNPRSLANFPMQANGAEMLRLACCLATENRIKVCAPVHDAVLIEAPLDCLDGHVSEMRKYMAEASRIVLDGFELRTDVDIVRYPDRYVDERGKTTWNRIMALVDKQEKRTADLLARDTPINGQVPHDSAGSSITLLY